MQIKWVPTLVKNAANQIDTEVGKWDSFIIIPTCNTIPYQL